MTTATESAAILQLTEGISRMSAAACLVDTKLGKFVYSTCNELVAPLEALAASPLPVSGSPILTWQERMDTYEGRYGTSTGRPAITYAKEEIADLRAALADSNASVAAYQQAEYERCEVAALVAVPGQSELDTPEFRKFVDEFHILEIYRKHAKGPSLRDAEPAPVSGATSDEKPSDSTVEAMKAILFSGRVVDTFMIHDLYRAAAPAGAVVARPDLVKALHLIHYDDRDCNPEVIIGDVAAHERYRQISQRYNAHLYVKVKSNSKDDPYFAANVDLSAPQAPDQTTTGEKK